jgi:hypothetical protein
MQFERAMRQVLPEGRLVRLTVDHPIFDSFFTIKSLDGCTTRRRAGAGRVLRIFEDNDPSKRVMVIVNYNNDIGDYMEWSGDGWYPVNLSNDAYKFATNYLIYGLTHPDSGIRAVEVAALHPTTPSNVLLNHYCPVQRESGTAADGAWVCTIALHHHAAPGTWRVAVSAYDWRPWPPNWDSTSVAFTVVNPRVDDTAPTLDELTFTQERVADAPGGESRLMSVTAHDDESGVLTVEYFLDSDTTPGVFGCGAERPARSVFPWQPMRTVSGTCPVPLVESDAPVYRTISLVRLTDARGNRRELNRDELARAGIVTRIDIRR